jgi:hypothetical protein
MGTRSPLRSTIREAGNTMPYAPLGRHNMASTLEPHLHLAAGHILFLDIVGYSKSLADEQKELIQELMGLFERRSNSRPLKLRAS